MKRSDINRIIREGLAFFNRMNFSLPDFASFTVDDWKECGPEIQEIIDLGLGWDITDFGSNDFDRTGLLLFTVRNGSTDDDRYPKPYCEKIMIAQPGQVTPFHFHWKKYEDIINRGGGQLGFRFHWATDNEDLDDRNIRLSMDGISVDIEAGAELILKPGQSVTLPPYLYHTFYGVGGTVMIGEVSSVNDDARDNRFFDLQPRFPEIEEDQKPECLLCNDYEQYQIGRRNHDYEKK